MCKQDQNKKLSDMLLPAPSNQAEQRLLEFTLGKLKKKGVHTVRDLAAILVLQKLTNSNYLN